MSGKFRFVFLWSCGCVLSERALKEVRQSLCHMCQHPFRDKDIVVLNGNEDEIELLKTKMAAFRHLCLCLCKKLLLSKRKTCKKAKTEVSKKDAINIETLTSEVPSEDIQKESEAGPN